MTGMQQNRTAPAQRRAAQPTGWTGWVAFAAVMMIMVGAFAILEGLVALFDDGFYLVRSNGLVLDIDYNSWGWIHLALGVIACATGAGLLSGNMAARIVGVAVAVLSALVNLVFISAYPVWSALVIILDVIVIYAIVVHGREMKNY